MAKILIVGSLLLLLALGILASIMIFQQQAFIDSTDKKDSFTLQLTDNKITSFNYWFFKTYSVNNDIKVDDVLQQSGTGTSLTFIDTNYFSNNKTYYNEYRVIIKQFPITIQFDQSVTELIIPNDQAIVGSLYIYDFTSASWSHQSQLQSTLTQKYSMQQQSSELADDFTDFNQYRWKEDNVDGTYSNWILTHGNSEMQFTKNESTDLNGETLSVETDYDLLLYTNSSSATTTNDDAPLGSISVSDSSFGSIGSKEHLLTVSNSASAITDTITNTTRIEIPSIFITDTSRNILFVFDSSSTITNCMVVYNISTPQTLNYITEKSVGRLVSGADYDETNQIMYVIYNGLTEGYIQSWDVSDLTNISMIDQDQIGSGAYLSDLLIYGDYLYVYNGNDEKLYRYDVSDTTGMVSDGSLTLGSHVGGTDSYIRMDITSNGKYLAICWYNDIGGGNYNNIFYLIDLTAGAVPFIKSSITISSSSTKVNYGCDIFDNNIYIICYGTNNSLIIDITDPTYPVITTSFDPVSTSLGNTIYSFENNFLFAFNATTGATNKLSIYDVTTITSPTIVQSLTSADLNQEIMVKPGISSDGNFMYVGGATPDTHVVLNITGYYNTTETSYRGNMRYFPAFNMTNLFALTTLQNNIQFSQLTLTFASIDAGDLTNPLRIYLFDVGSGDDYLTESGASGYSASQLQVWWNTTSQPYSSSYTNYFTGSNLTTALDISAMGNTWLTSRSASNKIFQIGIDVSGCLSTTLEQLDFTTITLVAQWDSYASDSAYYQISENLDPQDQFSISSNFMLNDLGDQNALYSDPNFFDIQVATGDNVGTWSISSFIRFRIRNANDSTDILIMWSTATGTFSYDPSITLSEDTEYTVTFIVDKALSSVRFSIFTASGTRLLTATNWQDMTSDNVANRPSFLYTAPTDSATGTTDVLQEKQGYLLLYNASSTAVISGTMDVYLTNVYSSIGGVNKYFRTIDSSIRDGTYIKETDPLGWQLECNASTVTAEGNYKFPVYDMRSISGLMGYNQPVRNETAGGVTVTVKLLLYPIFLNGTVDMDYMEIASYVDGQGVRLLLTDNTSFTRIYYIPGASDPIELEIGFGFSIQEQNAGRVAVAAVKAWDAKNTRLETHQTFMDLSSNHSGDFIIQSTHSFTWQANDESSEIVSYITDFDIVQGSRLDYVMPEIPVPKEVYVRPPRTKGFFEDPFGTIGGLIGGVGGSITGFFGGAWDKLIYGITHLDEVFGTLGSLILSSLLGAGAGFFALLSAGLDIGINLLPTDAQTFIRQWAHYDFSALLTLLLNVFQLITVSLVTLVALGFTYYIFFSPFLENDFEIGSSIGDSLSNAFNPVGFYLLSVPFKLPAIIIWFIFVYTLGWWFWIVPGGFSIF